MKKVISSERLVVVEKDLGLFRDLPQIPWDTAQDKRSTEVGWYSKIPWSKLKNYSSQSNQAKAAGGQH